MTHQDHGHWCMALASSDAVPGETRRIQLWLQVLRRMEAQYAQVAMQQGERLPPLSDAEREQAARLAARLHLPVPLPCILA